MKSESAKHGWLIRGQFAGPWLGACLLLIAVLPGLVVAGDTATRDPVRPGSGVSAKAIDHWIKQLDSDLFIERERATQSLIQAGSAAVDPVAAAADKDTLEVATRAVRILLELSEAAETATAHKALTRLARLKHRPAERRAAEARLGQMREKTALAAIVRLGGTEGLRYAVGGRQVVGQLLIGRRWRGGDDGLKYVRHLRWLQVLSIRGAPISDAGLAQLQGTPALVRIELYGTKVTSKGLAALRKALPKLEIDYRRGALLGVQGLPGTAGARVTRVTPGSAAAKAGLATLDVITALDGRPVKDFASLTRLVAARKPGDKATLQVVRGGQKLTIQVTFGAWQ